jgi:protein arginine N-methyltransferase 1
MYSIIDFGDMIADRVRMEAFAHALRRVVGPQTVVADIGTGTGIFALLACQLGARRVYAIEPDDAIQVAREIAAANGYADQIEFIQAISTRVELPERADVIVSDIGGALPWFQHHIPSIADARRRLLAPGGVLIPQRDRTWAAVAEAPELYARRAGIWSENVFGLDMEAARRLATNSWGLGRVEREQLLTPLERWATIDYAVVEDPDVRANVTWTVTRAGTGHGVVAGLDRVVLDDLCLSNAPDAAEAIRPRQIYGTVFFPWSVPVALAPGDMVVVDFAAALVGDNYCWSWNTRVRDRGETSREKAHFTQSTFFGAPLSKAQLEKRAATYEPVLNEEGRMLRFVLDAMSRSVALGEIAGMLAEQFPGRFRNLQERLSYVGEVSRLYA